MEDNWKDPIAMFFTFLSDIVHFDYTPKRLRFS